MAETRFRTVLTERLGLSIPVFQAPLAGGGDTAALVAAAGNGGGMGFIGAAYLTPEQILARATEIRQASSRPFGINLFAPADDPHISESKLTQARHALQPYFEEVRAVPPADIHAGFSFADQLDAALDTGAAVLSFTFGLPPADVIRRAHSKGMQVFGTATTVEEARAVEQADLDAVVAQGSEAGGHRGTFHGDFQAGMVGTMALVPQVVDAVGCPVIASGGIMDGRGIAAALCLGAAAVQMGTAFLTTAEAGIPEAYKQAILSAREDQTAITTAFSGRPARGIRNRFLNEIPPEQILPFPLQNNLTRPLRAAAAKQGKAEFLSLWSGQAPRLARRESAEALTSRLQREITETLSQFR